MSDYQLLDASTLQRLADGRFFSIPPEDSAETPGADYLRYLDDLENGATVLPAEPPPEPDPYPAREDVEALARVMTRASSDPEFADLVRLALPTATTGETP